MQAEGYSPLYVVHTGVSWVCKTAATNNLLEN